MHAYKTPLLTPRSALSGQLRRLAQVKGDAAPFLSAYIDLRRGRGPAERWLIDRAAALRAARQGRARYNFDKALELIEGVLGEAIHPAAQGLAVFARGQQGGRFLFAMQVDVPLKNGLVSYRVPDLAPLLRMDREAQHQVVLLAHSGILQIFDVAAGVAKPRAWMPFPNASVGRNGAAPDSSLASDRRAGSLEHLLASGWRELVVAAGDRSVLEQVVERLPSQVIASLSGLIDVPAELNQQAALQFVTQRLASDRQAKERHLLLQSLHGVVDGRPAVTGSQAVLEALRSKRAAKLLIAASGEASVARLCEHCGSIAVDGQWECCSGCGEPDVVPWLAETELARLASQQGLPVVYVDAQELRELGGVACLLGENFEPESAGEAQSLCRLDLVA